MPKTIKPMPKKLKNSPNKSNVVGLNLAQEESSKSKKISKVKAKIDVKPTEDLPSPVKIKKTKYDKIESPHTNEEIENNTMPENNLTDIQKPENETQLPVNERQSEDSLISGPIVESTYTSNTEDTTHQLESKSEPGPSSLPQKLSDKVKMAKVHSFREIRAKIEGTLNGSDQSNEYYNPKDTRSIIQVKNLVKKYGDFTAVNNISFDVSKGEVFGILGPNGAGKTTTLEILETLNLKTSGYIAIDGFDIDMYAKEIKQIIGVQLQSGGFYPKLSLIETLELFADIYNVDIDPIQFLENVNLGEKARNTVEQLSGGQRQRFSIATTLIANPSIIFLDEPTTGLDPQARRNLWDMIRDLKRKGKTVVLTTHYMDEAEILCDRIAIMDGGKILEINTVEGFIKDLLGRGFTKTEPKYGATLEDVFLDLTGKILRD